MAFRRVGAATEHGLMLSAIARGAVRRPLLVIVVWVAVVVGCFAAGLGVFDRLISDVGRVPGSESDRAYALIAQAGPQPGTLTAIIESPLAGDPARRAAVDGAVTDVRATPGVLTVTDPVPSITREAVLLRV